MSEEDPFEWTVKVQRGTSTDDRDTQKVKVTAGEDLIREVYDQPEKLVRGAARREHLDKLDDTSETDSKNDE